MYAASKSWHTNGMKRVANEHVWSIRAVHVSFSLIVTTGVANSKIAASRNEFSICIEFDSSKNAIPHQYLRNSLSVIQLYHLISGFVISSIYNINAVFTDIALVMSFFAHEKLFLLLWWDNFRWRYKVYPQNCVRKNDERIKNFKKNIHALLHIDLFLFFCYCIDGA